MSRFFTIATATLISSALTAIATYFIVSNLLWEAWREEVSYQLGFIEIESVQDSMRAQAQVLNAIAIAEAVESNETESLLTLACTGLAFSLPNIEPILYKDSSDMKQEEIHQIISDGESLLMRLRQEGVCLTRP